MDDYPPTPTRIYSGFTMSSRKYKVMFLTSNHPGDPFVISRVWVDLMDLILELLKFDDVNFENIQSELEDYLRRGVLWNGNRADDGHHH